MASTYGIDRTSTSTFATSYKGYFLSPLYRVGTILNKRAFSEIEFQLVKELATGEGIRISYRENLTDSFTVVNTFTYTTLGAVISHHDKTNIPATEFLQIKGELTGSSTTPEFLSITLR